MRGAERWTLSAGWPADQPTVLDQPAFAVRSSATTRDTGRCFAAPRGNDLLGVGVSDLLLGLSFGPRSWPHDSRGRGYAARGLHQRIDAANLW